MNDIALFFLRVSTGALLLVNHGLPKLLGFSARMDSFADPLGVGPLATLIMAILAEVVCASAVLLGLRTRLATIGPIAMLLVLIFVHHANDPWPRRDLALLYLAAFTTLLLAGGGRFSLDALLRRYSTGSTRTSTSSVSGPAPT